MTVRMLKIEAAAQSLKENGNEQVGAAVESIHAELEWLHKQYDELRKRVDELVRERDAMERTLRNIDLG